MIWITILHISFIVFLILTFIITIVFFCFIIFKFFLEKKFKSLIAAIEIISHSVEYYNSTKTFL